MRRFIAPPPGRGVSPGPRPTFSVVIPVYNAAATVGESIESALAQTSPPHEVVVCDDGSTDDLDRALEPYHDRIVLVRKENGGGASALNAAARRASGDFVVVLDSDDAYLPERLDALSELAGARPDLDILTTDALYESGGRVVGRFNGPANPFAASAQREEILKRCFILMPAVRRARVLELGGWYESLAIGYDWDCWLRLIFDGALAGSVDEPLVRYRFHDTSLSARRVDSLRERVTILERAASDPRLTEAERALVATSHADHRRTAQLAEAQEAIRDARPDARARLLTVAREPTFGRRTRTRALVLAHTPASLRRWLLPMVGFGGRFERRHIPGESRE
ncbi:MAG: glycosyltransferase family A protein [Actinomycetota bacterium]